MKTGVDPAIVPKMKLYTGEEIPCIGMGTFGSDRFTSEEVSGAVAGAIRCGYRMFDCASCYGNEDQIGMVFRAAMEEGVVKREELYIMTKVWNDMHERVEEACRKSIADLQCGYVDLYFIHWPFPNYHAPGCGGDSRNPAARPFSVEEYMNTYRQCEKLVEQGLIRHIGLSNMTVPKLKEQDIQPIGFMPLGSPQRPERDMMSEDIADMQLPEPKEIAKAHHCHPALICLKWAHQRGQIPIPFSVHADNYADNLRSVTEDPLTEEEMAKIAALERNNRLVKGQVFLWPGAKDWHDLWDEDGVIVGLDN